MGGGHQSRQVGDSARFTQATAKVIGLSERVVQRDAERGERVVPDVLAKVEGTKLDTGAYLDGLKKLPPEQQRVKVDRALKEPTPKRAAVSRDDAAFARLMKAWTDASPKVREQFLSRIRNAA